MLSSVPKLLVPELRGPASGKRHLKCRVCEKYHEADARTQQEYEDTGAAMESKRRLSDEEESELKSLWRKLVKLFHPDRFADDP